MPENWTRHGPGHLFVQADAESRVILGRVPRTKARHAGQGALKRHTVRLPLRMVRTGTACQLRKSRISATATAGVRSPPRMTESGMPTHPTPRDGCAGLGAPTSGGGAPSCSHL